MQSNVVHHLIETARQESRINSHKGPEPCLGHTSRRCQGVLFSDSGIKESLRISLLKWKQSSRTRHRRRNRHDVIATLSNVHQSSAELCSEGIATF